MRVNKAAMLFASRGFEVFPLVPYSKVPATKNGFKDASSDVREVEAMFLHDEYNLGIATGRASGFVVIDVDVKGEKDGLVGLKERFGVDFYLPENRLIFETPTGGLHVLVKWDPEIDVGNSVNALGIDGVDIRGNGGYIVAPPSVLKVSGESRSYRANDLELPMTEHFGWITTLLQGVSKRPRGGVDPVQPIIGVKEGKRNNTLFSYALHLRSRGLEKSLLIGFVMEAASRCQPPLCQYEARGIIENAYKYNFRKMSPKSKKMTLEDLE